MTQSRMEQAKNLVEINEQNQSPMQFGKQNTMSANEK